MRDAMGILALLLTIFRHGDLSKISDLARNFEFILDNIETLNKKIH